MPELQMEGTSVEIVEILVGDSQIPASRRKEFTQKLALIPAHLISEAVDHFETDNLDSLGLVLELASFLKRQGFVNNLETKIFALGLGSVASRSSYNSFTDDVAERALRIKQTYADKGSEIPLDDRLRAILFGSDEK